MDYHSNFLSQIFRVKTGDWRDRSHTNSLSFNQIRNQRFWIVKL